MKRRLVVAVYSKLAVICIVIFLLVIFSICFAVTKIKESPSEQIWTFVLVSWFWVICTGSIAVAVGFLQVRDVEEDDIEVYPEIYWEELKRE